MRISMTQIASWKMDEYSTIPDTQERAASDHSIAMNTPSGTSQGDLIFQTEAGLNPNRG